MKKISIDAGSVIAYLDLDTGKFSSSLKSSLEELKVFSNESQSLGEKIQRSGNSLSSLGMSLSKGLTVPILGVGTAIATTAVSFESAFAGVRKTFNATEAEFKGLEEGIRNMAKEMPASANEIANVAEVAGQLGIEKENILSFSKVMINLGESTNLNATEAAAVLAQFASITGMAQENFDRLGSTVVALGNNFATTEADIVSMAKRIAGAGTQVGMSEADILALSASLSSLGIESEAGGSSMSTLIATMQLATETGNEKLSQFANVANMTSEEFKAAFEENAVLALNSFVEGLANAEENGTSAIAMLNEMGFTEVTMRDALLRLAGAGDILSESLGVSSEAFEENSALSEEAPWGNKIKDIERWAKENEQIVEQIKLQTILVDELERQYNVYLETLGEEDEKTKEAYITLTNARTALVEMGNQYQKNTDSVNEHNEALKEQEKEVLKLIEEMANLSSKYQDEFSKALEDYREKVKEVNEDLIKKEEELTKKYEDELESRAKSLGNFVGLFAKFNQEYVSGQELLDNLENQVEVFSDWQSNIDLLKARGVNEDFLKELSQMGPSFANEVKALTSLSDVELEKYQKLLRQKNSLALDEANRQAGESQENLALSLEEARSEANNKLEEYAKDLEETNQEINEKMLKDFEGLMEDILKVLDLELDKQETKVSLAQKDNITVLKSFSKEWLLRGEDYGLQLLNGIKSTESEIVEYLNSISSMVSDGSFESSGDFLNAYALGTNYASSGWAVVGENGPELVLFNGGEKVISNDKLVETLASFNSRYLDSDMIKNTENIFNQSLEIDYNKLGEVLESKLKGHKNSIVNYNPVYNQSGHISLAEQRRLDKINLRRLGKYL